MTEEIISDDKKIKKREYDKKYYAKNRDKLIQSRQKYYQNNKEEIKEKKREYYQDNIEKYRQRRVGYYEAHAEEVCEYMSRRSVCECGKIMAFGSLYRHRKTNSHFKNLQKKNKLITENPT